MKIAVTGASGFIGKNLISRLQRLEEVELVEITRNTSVDDYSSLLENVDVIYHLAGVNRPKTEEEFTTGNTDLTEQLIRHLGGEKCPVFVMSSSTQALIDNPYGISKKRAEDLVVEATSQGKLKGVIYRLPGVFGKWSKPNYNSVISTFCHNVAHGKPLEIRDPNYTFPVVYVDDVVEQFLEQMSHDFVENECKFEEIRTVFNVSLGYLAKTISSFPTNRETLIAPAVGDTLTKYLYSTYLSYLPEDQFAYPMELKVDNRGDLFEWIKSEAFGQVFISTTKPGITRGNHYHHTKTEKFLVIRGEAVIRFRHIFSDRVIEYPVNGKEPKVVDIPTGYTHNITNVGDTELITLFWANEIFDQNRTDTYFLEV